MRDVVPWGGVWSPPGTATTPWTWIRRRPFTVAYMVIIWALAVPLLGPDGSVSGDIVQTYAYRPRHLVTDPILALREFFTAPWIHRNLVHLSYITVFFAVIAAPFEAHEGTKATILVFFVGSAFAALFAGVVLLLIQNASDAAWVAESTTWGWVGGSAGTFGLFGASVLRSKRPYMLVAIILTYELFNELLYLQNFTPVFHASALAAGVLTGRLVLRDNSRGTADGTAS